MFLTNFLNPHPASAPLVSEKANLSFVTTYV